MCYRTPCPQLAVSCFFFPSSSQQLSPLFYIPNTKGALNRRGGERACNVHRQQNAECYFPMYFQFTYFVILTPCFSLDWLSSALVFGEDLACELEIKDTEGAIRWHKLSCCWEQWLFELHPMILVLNLARYSGWWVTLAGRDSLPPLGWCFLSAINIAILLQDSFPLNVSTLTTYDFSHA